jgi:hypothetical protein
MLVGTLLIGAGPAAQAASKQVCIPLMTIAETPIIDDKTILLKQKGPEKYRRIDLLGPCPGMRFNGYAHSTRTNELCSTDVLVVLEPVGAICTIKDIVDISKDEAQALLSRKR